MSFESRVLDAINRPAQTYANVQPANRGLSVFLDPGMTGKTRFMQISGFPFGLLNPQMGAPLAVAGTQGSNQVTVQGTKLLPWLTSGVTISLELLEQIPLQSVVKTQDGNLLLTLTSVLKSSHDLGTELRIYSFTIHVTSNTDQGDGGLGAPAIQVTSPFLLAPGDVLTIAGTTYPVKTARQTGTSGSFLLYDLTVDTETGIPALSGVDPITVTAKPVYQSQILNLPHISPDSLVLGPVALDWVSGAMIGDYHPMPDSQVYLEEFTVSGSPITQPHLIQKNDVLSTLPISRDQFLFWKVLDGGMNWNGTFSEFKAFDSGLVHVWSPVRPAMDPIPAATKISIVPLFAPYAVITAPGLIASSVVVENVTTKQVIPSSLYTVDPVLGNINFDSSLQGTDVAITYRAQLKWRVLVRPSEDNLELCVKIGQDDKQVFLLPNGGVATTITVQTSSVADIDQIHITGRRQSGDPGPLKIEMGDWSTTSRQTACVRYTLFTGADIDYAWSASSLIVQPIWPNLNLLRAKLDGTGALSSYLDSGKLLV